VGIDELVSRLEHDADARIAELQARARAEVTAIADTADQASARARAGTLAGLRAQRRTRLEREVVGARQAARAAQLRAEHAFLDRVMTRAGELLETMERDEAYVSSLPGRLVEALAFVDPRGARVRCRPSLAAAVRLAVAARDVTVEEVAGMAVGFTVVAGDGSVEVSDTLPARLERLRPRLLIELLAEADQ
jgi:vacuolar-type H+-ATPase subunit E/Vma4